MQRTQLLNPDFRGNYSNIEEMLLDGGYIDAGEIDNRNPETLLKVLTKLYDSQKQEKIADYQFIPSYLAKDGSVVEDWTDDEDKSSGINEKLENMKYTHTLYVKCK